MNKTRVLTFTAVFTALVAVTTAISVFPLPSGNGYINVGDAIIFMAGIFFGPFVGMIAGGIGSAAADLIRGYALWAPFSLVIKGIEGAIVGFVSALLIKALKPKFHFFAYIIAMIVAGIVMIAGYFLASWLLYGLANATIEILGSLIQIGSSIVVASILIGATKSLFYAIKKGDSHN